MYPAVPLWECPICGSRMLQGYRQGHKCKCQSCGEEVPGEKAETHECNDAAREILRRREIERQVAEAKTEMDDMPAVAARIDAWAADCTTDLPKDVPDEEAEARVTIESKRKWADWCREHGL